jgi:hypothetical protein
MRNQCPKCQSRTMFRQRLALAVGRQASCRSCRRQLQLRQVWVALIGTLSVLAVLLPPIPFLISGSLQAVPYLPLAVLLAVLASFVLQAQWAGISLVDDSTESRRRFWVGIVVLIISCAPMYWR